MMGFLSGLKQLSNFESENDGQFKFLSELLNSGLMTEKKYVPTFLCMNPPRTITYTSWKMEQLNVNGVAN